MARDEHCGFAVHDATLEDMDPEIFLGERLRPISRREYDELVELGWFEDEPIELLRGMLVEMTPQGNDHSDIGAWIAHRFMAVLSIYEWDVRTHSPYAATDDSEPEPDVQVSRKPKPRGSHPTSALLVVEVSRSSLRKDRKLKLPIYAENGVPEYWIVDLVKRAVEVYTEPVNGTYAHVEHVDMTGTLRPRFDPSIAIAMAELPWEIVS